MKKFKVIYEVEVTIRNEGKDEFDIRKLTALEKATIRTHADVKVLEQYGLSNRPYRKIKAPVITEIDPIFKRG